MRVGVLGLGSIGLRHARNIISLGHEVLGFDPDEGRQGILGAYGGIPASREAVLSGDCVVIASPTPEHYQDLQELKSPALVEKPIADRQIEFQTDRVALVGYNLRYHSCVKQAKDWIETGYIGRPLNGHFVLAQYNDKPAYLRDGVVLNWSHEIDLCLHLLGPANLIAEVNKDNTISNLFLGHDYIKCVSTVHLNYINKKEERYFGILGDRGRIHCVLAPYRMAECYQDDGSVITYTYETTFDEDYVTEMKAFLGGDIGPGCTAQQAKDVLKICLGL